LKAIAENVPVNTEERWTAKDPHTAFKVGVSQEFPGAYKRDLRTERAEREARLGLAKVEVQRAAVQREVAVAWIARHFANQAEGKVSEQIAEAELAVESGRARYRAGKGTQAELIALQSAVVELENRRTEIGVKVKRAQIALARFVGADANRPLGDPPDLGRLPRGAAELLDADESPEVRAALAQEIVVATDADLARGENWPDWMVELSYGWRGRAGDVAHPGHPADPGFAWSQLISLEVEVGLPLFSATRQEPRYAAKLRELDAARGSREKVKRRQSAEVQRTAADWDVARAQAMRIKDELIPLAVQRREAALAAYRGGTGTLAAVLEARRSELAAQLALIAQEQAAGIAWAWLAFVLPVAEKS
jgi:outer membrane protein TolC